MMKRLFFALALLFSTSGFALDDGFYRETGGGFLLIARVVNSSISFVNPLAWEESHPKPSVYKLVYDADEAIPPALKESGRFETQTKGNFLFTPREFKVSFEGNKLQIITDSGLALNFEAWTHANTEVGKTQACLIHIGWLN